VSFFLSLSQPDEYISFFSLRGWGKFKDGVLTTEMVYIHAKTMIVDDRLAIIGEQQSTSFPRSRELIRFLPLSPCRIGEQ